MKRFIRMNVYVDGAAKARRTAAMLRRLKGVRDVKMLPIEDDVMQEGARDEARAVLEAAGITGGMIFFNLGKRRQPHPR
jgi:hypothetical protein